MNRFRMFPNDTGIINIFILPKNYTIKTIMRYMMIMGLICSILSFNIIFV